MSCSRYTYTHSLSHRRSFYSSPSHPRWDAHTLSDPKKQCLYTHAHTLVVVSHNPTPCRVTVADCQPKLAKEPKPRHGRIYAYIYKCTQTFDQYRSSYRWAMTQMQLAYLKVLEMNITISTQSRNLSSSNPQHQACSPICALTERWTVPLAKWKWE